MWTNLCIADNRALDGVLYPVHLCRQSVDQGAQLGVDALLVGHARQGCLLSRAGGGCTRGHEDLFVMSKQARYLTERGDFPQSLAEGSVVRLDRRGCRTDLPPTCSGPRGQIPAPHQEKVQPSGSSLAEDFIPVAFTRVETPLWQRECIAQGV